jgi:hypothetical protein
MNYLTLPASLKIEENHNNNSQDSQLYCRAVLQNLDPLKTDITGNYLGEYSLVHNF